MTERLLSACITQEEHDLIDAVAAEVVKARRKFPTWPNDPLHALAVVAEEQGELTKNLVQSIYEPHKTNHDEVKAEALQLAAMALRFLFGLNRYKYAPCGQHIQPNTAAPTALQEAGAVAQKTTQHYCTEHKRHYVTENRCPECGYVPSPQPPQVSAATGVWQPISTAPTNISVLVFIPNAEHYGEGIYRALQVDMRTGRHWQVTGLHFGRDCDAVSQPTHWQPLPEPPLDRTEEAKQP